MYQSIIVTLSLHHQFIFSRRCKDNLTAISRAWHLHVRKEGAQ
jgi:acyl-coenzyme A thioesterase PaaI-like protein